MLGTVRALVVLVVDRSSRSGARIWGSPRTAGEAKAHQPLDLSGPFVFRIAGSGSVSGHHSWARFYH